MDDTTVPVCDGTKELRTTENEWSKAAHLKLLKSSDICHISFLHYVHTTDC